jgi:hypothetical protein
VTTESHSTAGVPKIFPTVQHCWAKCSAAQGQYFIQIRSFISVILLTVFIGFMKIFNLCKEITGCKI